MIFNPIQLGLLVIQQPLHLLLVINVPQAKLLSMRVFNEVDLLLKISFSTVKVFLKPMFLSLLEEFQLCSLEFQLFMPQILQLVRYRIESFSRRARLSEGNKRALSWIMLVKGKC